MGIFLVRRALENPVHFKFIWVFVKFLIYKIHAQNDVVRVARSYFCPTVVVERRDDLFRERISRPTAENTRVLFVSSWGGCSPEMHSTNTNLLIELLLPAGQLGEKETRHNMRRLHAALGAASSDVNNSNSGAVFAKYCGEWT